MLHIMLIVYSYNQSYIFRFIKYSVNLCKIYEDCDFINSELKTYTSVFCK